MARTAEARAYTVTVADRGDHAPAPHVPAHAPAHAPAMGQAHDFASAECPPHQRAASIEVASAEALRILQRHYGATTEGKRQQRGLGGGSDGIGASFSVGGSWLQLLPLFGRNGYSSAGLPGARCALPDDAPELAALVKQCACLSLAVPIVVLGPWLNVVLASLIRGLASSAGPIVQHSAVAVVDIERATAQRVGLIFVSCGLLAAVVKLLFTAPCIGAGGALLDRLLPRRRDGLRAARTDAASVVDAEAGGGGKGEMEKGEVMQGKFGG